MKFAVQLINCGDMIDSAADCFQGDAARIRRIGNDWFLESSTFNKCIAPVDVFPIADKLLRVMQCITAVHARLFSICEIGYVQAFTDLGVETTRALRGTQMIQVISSQGLQELSQAHGAQSKGSAIVAAAMSNTQLEEGLSLVGTGYELQWTHIYNILEFLRPDAVVKKKWATRQQIGRCKQTANHYRHLGTPRKYPLPSNPPTKGEAGGLVLGLLRKWIFDELGTNQ